MEMKLILSIVAALLYWIAWQSIFYDFMEGFTWMPMVHGVIFGLITGHLSEGLLLGASISALYVSLVNAGGTVPSDCPAAGTIAIPIALMSNMNVGEAITVAITVSVIGNLIQPIQFNINGIFVHMADKYASQGNLIALKRINWLAFIPTFLLRFPIAFAIVYFGTPIIDSIMAIIPEWLSNGLSVAGGVLPALGIAVTLFVINRNKYIPIFLIGYFLVVIFNVSTVMAAIFGISFIALYTVLSLEDEKLNLIVNGDDDDD